MWFLQAIPIIGKIFDFGNNITNAIRDLNIRKVQAQSEKEKAQIQKEIDQLQAQATLQGIEANSKNQLNAFVRFTLFGLPAGLAIWKLVVFDKIIGSLTGCSGTVSPVHMDACKIFRTDSFDVNMWWVILASAGFYLVTSRNA